MFALELKTAQGRVAPEQVAWLDRLEDAGVACAVVRDIDTLEGIMDAFEKMGA
jgi:hypothetical protein